MNRYIISLHCILLLLFSNQITTKDLFKSASKAIEKGAKETGKGFEKAGKELSTAFNWQMNVKNNTPFKIYSAILEVDEKQQFLIGAKTAEWVLTIATAPIGGGGASAAASTAGREVAETAGTIAAREITETATTAAAREITETATTTAAREIAETATTTAARETAESVATTGARAAARESTETAATTGARAAAKESAESTAQKVGTETAEKAAVKPAQREFNFNKELTNRLAALRDKSRVPEESLSEWVSKNPEILKTQRSLLDAEVAAQKIGTQTETAATKPSLLQVVPEKPAPAPELATIKPTAKPIPKPKPRIAPPARAEAQTVGKTEVTRLASVVDGPKAPSGATRGVRFGSEEVQTFAPEQAPTRITQSVTGRAESVPGKSILKPTQQTETIASRSANISKAQRILGEEAPDAQLYKTYLDSGSQKTFTQWKSDVAKLQEGFSKPAEIAEAPTKTAAMKTEKLSPAEKLFGASPEETTPYPKEDIGDFVLRRHKAMWIDKTRGTGPSYETWAKANPMEPADYVQIRKAWDAQKAAQATTKVETQPLATTPKELKINPELKKRLTGGFPGLDI